METGLNTPQSNIECSTSLLVLSVRKKFPTSLFVARKNPTLHKLCKTQATTPIDATPRRYGILW